MFASCFGSTINHRSLGVALRAIGDKHKRLCSNVQSLFYFNHSEQYEQ
jgi:hypothetical protein